MTLLKQIITGIMLGLLLGYVLAVFTGCMPEFVKPDVEIDKVTVEVPPELACQGLEAPEGLYLLCPAQDPVFLPKPEDGEDGTAGIDGGVGDNGADGAPGTNGVDGTDGAPGLDGLPCEVSCIDSRTAAMICPNSEISFRVSQCVELEGAANE